MEQKVILSVVTVTYKPDVTELKLFLDSFCRYNDLGTDARLIIVDNSPENSWDTAAIASEYPDVTFIPNPSNPGFGASNNLGFEHYQSEYVLFVNNDVEFLEPIFKNIIMEFDKNQGIGCIGIYQEGGAPSFFPKMTCPKGASTTTFIDRYHFISGAFMFFKSSIFIECGKFDPQLFMYFEEFDISERLIAHNYKTIYLDQYHFLHKAGHRTTQNEFAAQKGSDSFCYICKKYKLDYRPKNSAYIKRMRKMMIYNILTFNIKEVLKLNRIINYRKKVIKENLVKNGI